MGLKKYRPLTPSLRYKISSDFAEITADKPEKSLIAKTNKSSGGRNNTGKMTMRYIGGGHKKALRTIDFKRDKDGIEGTVKTIEYDPNRSARIALVFYKDGEKRYSVTGEIGFPFFGEFILDCINRTENSMTQEHAFKAAELCLIAQEKAVKIK